MKPFSIEIPELEYQVVLVILPGLPVGTSIFAASRTLLMNENHLRYIVDVLVANGRLRKIEVDSRVHHKRYKFERVEEYHDRD